MPNMNTQINLDAFHAQLTKEYERLFTTHEYKFAAISTTPSELAKKMTLGLDSGSANKDGEGVLRTCKHFNIPYTYKAIRNFLSLR